MTSPTFAELSILFPNLNNLKLIEMSNNFDPTAIEESDLRVANSKLCEKLTHINRVRYAVKAAESCLQDFESKYPKDKRPRKAIESAKAWIANPTEENRKRCEKAADAAAHSAFSAAYSAYSAATSKSGKYNEAVYKKTLWEHTTYGLELLQTQQENILLEIA